MQLLLFLRYRVVDLHTMQDSLLCTQRTKWARVLLLLMDTIRLICTVCAAAPCLKVFSKISTFYCFETAHRSNMRVLLSGKGIALLFHSLGRSVGHSANTPFFPERKKPIKTLTREETLDIKIEIVSSFIAELTANQRKDADTSRLLQVLLAFDQMLLREKNQTVMGVGDLSEIKKAICEARSLLVDLAEDEPQDMEGWHHGAKPANSALALANALSRMILEMSGAVRTFESKFKAPKCKCAMNPSY